MDRLRDGVQRARTASLARLGGNDGSVRLAVDDGLCIRSDESIQRYGSAATATPRAAEGAVLTPWTKPSFGQGIRTAYLSSQCGPIVTGLLTVCASLDRLALERFRAAAERRHALHDGANTTPEDLSDH
jgi:hypothetical protein